MDQVSTDSVTASAESHQHDDETIDLLELVTDAEVRTRLLEVLQTTTISRPKNAFNSDKWTATTVAGIAKLGNLLRSKRTAEIGVGAGPISIIHTALNQPQLHECSDYVASHIDATRKNVTEALNEHDAERFVYHEGSQSLLNWYDPENPQQEPLDAIIACIPQVVNRKHDDAPDKEANYIPDELLTGLSGEVEASKFDLQLNMALLKEVKEKKALSDEGFVCLTLGGRPGETVLRHLVALEGFAMEIVHASVVPQDPHTDISSLKEHEEEIRRARPEYTFAFYEDEEATMPIGAERASQLLDQKLPVYHEVLIVKCTPIKE